MKAMPPPTSKARPLRCVTVGDGPALVLLHGYAMQPETYLPLARLLADRARVVIPAIFALPERWSFDHALECLELTVDDQGIDHDWMFDDPELFVAHLEALGLQVLSKSVA